jgi:hypothetical protein
MIEIDCEQGTPEWLEARLGVPSASNFGRIVTATGKISTSKKAYMLDLLAEKLTGEGTDFVINKWMERGTELEPEAADLYSFITDRECVEKGFLLDDSKAFGCSPDRIVENGGLEIKCPKPATHVEYLLAGKAPTKYLPQIQGCMLVTGALWWDFMSYCPGIKPLIVRVERDEEYITKLKAELLSLSEELNDKLKQIEG